MQFSKENPMHIAVMVLLIAIGVGVFAWSHRYAEHASAMANPEKYQVVFLTGNQQFFGHLHDINTQRPYITDIYYIQNQTDAEGKPGFKLIKWGNEIHGPEDVMYINWNNLIFWNNLRDDSQVTQGIAQQKSQQKGQIAPVAPPSEEHAPPLTPASSNK